MGRFAKEDFDLYFQDILVQASNLDIVQYSSAVSRFVRRAARGTETSNTPVAGANDTAIGADKQKYTFFTFPSTAAYFEVTGIEVHNGTVLDGNWSGVVYRVDANPPTLA